mgnify:CR=1 FL=1
MAGGYFQPRANTGAALGITWSNICYQNLDVVPDAGVHVGPHQDALSLVARDRHRRLHPAAIPE